MKTHTTIGFELLKGRDSTILQAATTIAVAHQEKFDGIPMASLARRFRCLGESLQWPTSSTR